MKKNLITILKWFFIILGVLTFLQIILCLIAFYTVWHMPKTSFAPFKIEQYVSGDMQKLENYVSKYKQENGVLPEKIENVKLDKDAEFEYKVSDDKNCYTIILNNKKKNSKEEHKSCNYKSEDIKED